MLFHTQFYHWRSNKWNKSSVWMTKSFRFPTNSQRLQEYTILFRFVEELHSTKVNCCYSFQAVFTPYQQHFATTTLWWWLSRGNTVQRTVATPLLQRWVSPLLKFCLKRTSLKTRKKWESFFERRCRNYCQVSLKRYEARGSSMPLSLTLVSMV